jgi:nucleoid-associated protein YgaU
MEVVTFQGEAGEDLLDLHQADGRSAAARLVRHIAMQGLAAQDLHLSFDPATGIATVAGVAPDQATREKIVLCCGNVQGVSQVCDLLDVALPAAQSHYYTVAGGDTLAQIAGRYYRDPHAYGRIFEANRPMLRHPDHIYPGQLLRIPE